MYDSVFLNLNLVCRVNPLLIQEYINYYNLKKVNKVKLEYNFELLSANINSYSLFAIRLQSGSYERLKPRYASPHVSTYIIRKIIKFLVKNDYIKIHKGFFSKEQSYTTRVERLKYIDVSHIQERVKELIILRDKNKQNVQYKDSYTTRLWEKQLRKVNKTYSNITFKGQVFKVSLRRIFNNSSFKQGGRFYGRHQELKSEERKLILIENVQTVEIDFRYMHAQLIYLIEGLDLAEDPYHIQGISRKMAKVIFQILINTKSRKTAINSIKYKFELSEKRVISIVDSFCQKHNLISSWFFCSKGLFLHRKESDLTFLIIQKCLNLNIVILPIHDSFIVKKRHRDDLIKIMEECSLKLFKYKLSYRIT